MLPIDGEKMKAIKVIVDKKPYKVTDCIFLKVGLFCDKCKLTKQRIGKVCFTDKCPLEEQEDN